MAATASFSTTIDQVRDTATSFSFVDASLPSYRIDGWVKPSKKSIKSFGKSAWKWSQLALVGRTLYVTHQMVLLGTYVLKTQPSTAQPITYTLVPTTTTVEELALFFPSAAASAKFLAVINASQATEHWTPPSATALDNMVHVAAAILEGVNVSPAGRPVGIPDPKEFVTVEQVQAYLRRLHEVYTAMNVFKSKDELYKAVVKMAADFAADPSKPSSLIQLVLDLNPDVDVDTGFTTQLACAVCPTCSTALHPASAVIVHAGGTAVYCRLCNGVLSYETFKLVELLEHLPKKVEFRAGMFTKSDEVIHLPGIPADGKLKTYLAALWSSLNGFSTNAGDKCPIWVYKSVCATISKVMGRLDLVQLMHRQLLFISQMAPHVEYWLHTPVIQASMRRFKQFQHLAIKVVGQGSPVATLDITLIAQALQTRSAKLVLPRDQGSSGLMPRLVETAILWDIAFLEPYTSVKLDKDAWIRAKVFTDIEHKRWAKHVRPPSHDSRFVGVEESFPVESLTHAAAFKGMTGQAAMVSVIGALEFDARIAGGQLRDCLPVDPTKLYDGSCLKQLGGHLAPFLQ